MEKNRDSKHHHTDDHCRFFVETPFFLLSGQGGDVILPSPL